MGPTENPTLPTAVIFDVDGTLCDVRSVRHYVERPPGAVGFRRDFVQFHRASEACPSFPRVAALASRVREQGFAVVVVTGREARWRELTLRWLEKQRIGFDDLLTRPAGDYRPDAEVKEELLMEICTRWAPTLAVDDRDDILTVWQAAGIATVAVTGTGGLTLRWTPDRAGSSLGTIIGRI